MQKAVDKMNENATRLGDLGDELNVKASEMLLQFDTLVQLQKEERVEYQRMHHEAMKDLTKHYMRIIIALILTLILFIGGVIGTVAYFMVNFDVQFGYVQDAYIGGDGTNNINDGLHINGE